VRKIRDLRFAFWLFVLVPWLVVFYATGDTDKALAAFFAATSIGLALLGRAYSLELREWTTRRDHALALERVAELIGGLVEAGDKRVSASDQSQRLEATRYAVLQRRLQATLTALPFEREHLPSCWRLVGAEADVARERGDAALDELFRALLMLEEAKPSPWWRPLTH
jgi:hypothetical protein